MLPAANPAAARVLERSARRRSTCPTDLTLAQIAAIRAAVDVPLDVYVEAPDNVGGFVRHHEIPELIRVAAPVYVKFGLRNAPDVYPAGTHLEATTVALSRERVRRARLGLELLARSGYEPTTSELGAAGLAVPALAPNQGDLNGASRHALHRPVGRPAARGARREGAATGASTGSSSPAGATTSRSTRRSPTTGYCARAAASCSSGTA